MKDNICQKCGSKMKSAGTVDETWRFYKCNCGHTSAKHIHSHNRETPISSQDGKLKGG